MTKYHSGARTLYFILCAISIGGFYGAYLYRSFNGLIDPDAAVPYLKSLTLALACVFISAVICSRIAANSYKKQLHILDEECDPVKFMKETAKGYKKACRVTRVRSMADSYACTIRSNYAVAKAMNGEYDEAIDISRRLLTVDSTRIPPLCPFNMLHTATFLASRGGEGDIAEAKQLVENANSIMQQLPPAGGNALAIELSNAMNRIDIAEGTNSSECVDSYAKRIDGDYPRRAKLASRWMLACAYKALGDTEKEREQLEILASEGTDKMQYMRDAAARLAELGQQ